MNEFQERGSSWALVKILYLMVGIVCFDPLRTNAGNGNCMELPRSILKTNAVINIRNEDKRCFAWSLMAHFYPATDAKEEVSSYPQNIHDIFNFRGITFPIKLSSTKKFELKNQNLNISINVYGYDKVKNYVFGPIYKTDEVKENHINLLLISRHGNQIGHYCYIKNLSALI